MRAKGSGSDLQLFVSQKTKHHHGSVIDLQLDDCIKQDD
jgi:hypothetical protein